MTPLVIRVACALGLGMTGCDPLMQSRCEASVECGYVADVDTCLRSVTEQRAAAQAANCGDAFDAMSSCQLDVEVTCGPVDPLADIPCSRSTCEYFACRNTGAGSVSRCAEDVDPTGLWELNISSVAGACGDSLSARYNIIVAGTDGAFELTPRDATVPVTGTIETSPMGALMSVVIGSDGTRPMFDLDAIARPGPTSNAAFKGQISGSGTRSLNGCTGKVSVYGDLRGLPP